MRRNSLGAIVGLGMLTAVAGNSPVYAGMACQLNIGQELSIRNFSGSLTTRMREVCDNVTGLVAEQFPGQETNAAHLASQAVRDMLDGLQNNCPKGSVIGEWSRQPSTVSVSTGTATVYVNSGLKCARPNGTNYPIDKTNGYVLRNDR